MSELVPAIDLAAMQFLDRKSFDRRVIIVSRVRVSDNAGGSTFTETVQVNVPCRRKASDAGEVERMFGGQLVSGLAWRFAFPVDTVITTDDEIIDGAVPEVAGSGELFAVMAVLGPMSYETARLVFASKK